MGCRIAAGFSVAVLLLPALSLAQEKEPEVEQARSVREEVTIGVMEFKAVDVPRGQVDVIADFVAGHISRLGDVHVISKMDIVSMLNLEKQKRLAGCTDKECVSEIAGALGMPWMVTGGVTRMGGTFLVSIKLVDVRNAVVVSRSARRIEGDLEDVLEELPEATQELFDRGGIEGRRLVLPIFGFLQL
jgi:TolB-like protein